MLTVLIRYTKTRVEVLKAAERVEYTPPHGVGKNPEDAPRNEEPGLLLVTGEHGEKIGLSTLAEINDGNYRDVFVMNDRGATVARYVL